MNERLTKYMNGIWIMDISILLLTVAYKYFMMQTSGKYTMIYIFIVCLLVILIALKVFTLQVKLKENSIENLSSKIILVGLFVLIVTVITRDPNMLIPFLLAGSFYFQSSKHFVRCFFTASLICFIVHFIFYFMGIIEDSNSMIRYVDGEIKVRYSLGFEHPNSVFLFFSPIVFSYFYIKDRYITFGRLILLLVTIVIFEMTDSRTGFFLLLLFYWTMLFGQKAFFKKIVQKMIQHSFLIFTGISLWIASVFGELGNEVNSFLSNRPLIWNRYLSLGVNLFGQDIQALAYTNPLDNYYIYILYDQGLIIWGLIAFLYYNFFKQAIKYGNIKLTIIMFFYLIYGLFETNTILFSTNFTLAFLFVSYFEPKYFSVGNPKLLIKKDERNYKDYQSLEKDVC